MTYQINFKSNGLLLLMFFLGCTSQKTYINQQNDLKIAENLAAIIYENRGFTNFDSVGISFGGNISESEFIELLGKIKLAQGDFVSAEITKIKTERVVMKNSNSCEIFMEISVTYTNGKSDEFITIVQTDTSKFKLTGFKVHLY